MWIFDTIELLPRPSFRGLAPHLALLVVYLVFRDLPVAVAGHAVSPRGLAVLASLALSLGRNLPSVLTAARALNLRWAVLVPVVVVGFVVLVGAFAAPLLVQKGWLLGWILYATTFLWFVQFGADEDIDRLPSRWASADEPLSRPVLMIHALRLAGEAFIASWMMQHATVLTYAVPYAIVLVILARDAD